MALVNPGVDLLKFIIRLIAINKIISYAKPFYCVNVCSFLLRLIY